MWIWTIVLKFVVILRLTYWAYELVQVREMNANKVGLIFSVKCYILINIEHTYEIDAKSWIHL